jgi:hypothetical protein
MHSFLTLTLVSKSGSFHPKRGARETMTDVSQIMRIMVPMVRNVLEWM